MRIVSITVGPEEGRASPDGERWWAASVTLEDRETGVTAVGRASGVARDAKVTVSIALADAMAYFTRHFRESITVTTTTVATWDTRTSRAPTRTCAGP